MKYLYMLGSALMLTICNISVSAQTDRINEPDHNKPKLFENLSKDIAVNPEQLADLLIYQVGQPVNITLASGFIFQGHVVSTATLYENSIQSVVVALTNYNGARLTFSKVINADRRTSYTGRIISFQHGDLFELVNRENQYYFVKKKLYDLVNE